MESKVCFFADGDGYQFDPTTGTLSQISLNVSEIPLQYFASPSTDSPQRIAAVENLPDAFALISSGRVEAFPTGTTKSFGGLQFSRDTLALGQWVEPDLKQLLMAFHCPNALSTVADFNKTKSNLKLVSFAFSTDRPPNWPSHFEWLLGKAEVQDTTAGLWFNENRDNPVCYLADICSTKRVLGNGPLGYHRFDLSITHERLKRIWKIIGTGELELADQNHRLSP
ncbi:MAG: hypothetical protein ACOVQM_17335 [Pirellula sp.]